LAGLKVLDSAPRAVRIEAPAGAPVLEEIVKWPDVRAVTRFQPPRLFCSAGCATIGVNALRAGGNPLWTGKDELIAVFDSGIDDAHPDLAPAIHSKLAMPNARAVDDIGHGTLVAGIIAGRGTAGGPTGVATDAKLIDRSMVNDAGRLILPMKYDDLFGPAVAAGANILNLSWGTPIGGDYDQGSRDVDEFAYEHPEVLLVIAAGNEGRSQQKVGKYDFKTLAAPASAKNAITVGASSLVCSCADGCACKSTHSQKWPQFFSVPPIAGDPIWTGNGDSVRTVGISSRGPTTHDSVKPDIIAPGVLVESTRSQHAPAGWFETGCPAFEANRYACHTGTSFAAPFVSGAAAVLRQYVREVANIPKPTAALLKAMLLAAATRVPAYPADRQDLSGFPDFDQGFGALDLSTLLPHLAAPAGRKLMLVDIRNDSPEALASRQAPDSPIRSYRTLRFKIPAGAVEQPLRVVLCWTDPPGVFLQNNLQLDVTVLDEGTTHTGNEEHKFLRDPLSMDTGDKRNNVEVVTIAKPKPGEYRARVYAQNTSRPNQGYALVIVGCVEPVP
jgi:serine protease AprX